MSRSSDKQHDRGGKRRRLARRLLTCEPLEHRNLLTCDASVCVDVQFVEPIAPTVTLSQLQTNREYEARVFVQDNRGGSASGVFQAYFDATYNNNLISVLSDDVDHGPQYPIRRLGDASIAGVINAAGGGSAGIPNPPGGSFLLFSFPFQTDAAGTLTLNLAPDNLDINKVEFFIPGGPVSDIAYAGNVIEINELLGPVVSITPATAGNESGPVNGVFTVTQAVATSVNTVVAYTVSGTATPGSDYTALSGSVTIPANSTSAMIPVPVLDDARVDPGETVTVTLTSITSGAVEATINPTSNTASITILDNDTASVLVSPAAGLVTSEAGLSASFQVSLGSQPSGNVTIALASSNASEGTVSPLSLVFTPDNWNILQTATVRGVNDFIDDGDVGYSILTTATSSDPLYQNFSVADVSVTNIDDDAAGITVSPLSGLRTSEAGATQTFSVRLDSQPTANVVIGIASSNSGEGTVSVPSLTFTPGNWNTPQIVTVTGVDDSIDDGDQSYQIVTAPATSSDANYSGRNPADVSVINADNDTAGFLVEPLGGLMTTEAGGSADFSVRLRSQPTANVSIGLSVSDATEGSLNLSSLVFTPANWNQPQTVTITGVDDAIDDANVSHAILFAAAVSQDAGYANTRPADVSVTNIDNDVAGITVAPTSGLITSESGGTATFNIVLTSQPTAAVTIGVASGDPSEGSVSSGSLVFTTANWNVPQPVTVTGVNDDVDDGDIAYTIVTAAAVSSDPNYNNRSVADVSVINTDNDAAGVLVAPTSGLITSESGGTATFTVRLTSQPSSNVSISLTSSNSAEGTVSVSTLTFAPANWQTPRVVTITGVDDSIDDGDSAYIIITGNTASADAAYNGLSVDDVQVTNADDDAVGILVAPVSGLFTSEAGQSAQFAVSLGSRPTANVTIALSSSNANEGIPDKSSLTFTPQNWNAPQSVNVTGVNDLVDDGDVEYRIVTAAATSIDAAYNGLNGPDVSIRNFDDDTAGVLIEPVAGLQTSEAGNTASFTVVLASQPRSPVTISLASSDPSEGMIDFSSLAFNDSNWNLRRTVTVRGVNDLFDDGDVAYRIVTAPASSSDTAYFGLDPADVSVTNIDDDVPGIAIVPTAGLITSEQGQTASFNIVLTSQPTANVVIPLSSSNPSEGTPSLASVTFTPTNFNVPQTVTVQGVNDGRVDGSLSYSIITGVAASADPVFSGINPADVALTNLDDDVAELTVTAVSAVEGTGGADSMFVFEVALSKAVAGAFRVDFATADGTAIAAAGDYTLHRGTLNFAGDQNEVQTFTVPVKPDATVEAAETFRVSLSNLAGIPAQLAQRIMLPELPTEATILNDDTATLTIVGPAPTLEGTDDEDTVFGFSVQLSHAVQGGFSVAYRTQDGTALRSDGDFQANDGVLTFAGNPRETQLIDVAVRADDRVEANETLSVILGAISNLQGVRAEDIQVPGDPVVATIINDDFPRLLLTNITANPTEGTGGTTTEFVFQVTLTDAVDDPDGFQVPFQVADGTATVTGGDYIDPQGVLSFTGSAGEARTFSVLVNQDAIVEADETFVVSLGPLSGLEPGRVVSIPVPELQAIIINDDTASLVMTADLPSRNEGGSFQLTVVLSAAVEGGFSVDYATSDGTASAADGDYVQIGDTLSFNGTTNETRSFSVQSLQDAKVELDELFTVALQALAGLPAGLAEAITISPPVQLTILNEDMATITLSAPSPIAEGGQGGANELLFNVSLSAPVQNGFSINHQTIGVTATAGSDFVVNDGMLLFSGEDAEIKTIRVPIIGDRVVEASETLRMVLGQLTGLIAGLEADVIVQNNQATATILNDDTATLSLAGPGAKAEGTGVAATNFVFSVTLSAPVQGGLRVAFNSNDATATVADGDFQNSAGTLIFAGTENETQTTTVAVTADDRVEPNETFELVLGAISGLPIGVEGAVQVAESSATATITNDDFPRLLLTNVTPNSVEGTEGTTTEFVFQVTLTDAVDDANGFQVPFQVNDGTATVAGGDYIDNQGVLAFSGTAGETRTFSVLVNQDTIVEADEKFTVSLGPLSGLEPGQIVIIVTPSLTTTIEDDDSATLALSAAQTSLDEGDSGTTAFVFNVMLSAAVQGGFGVAYSTSDLTATAADGDYVDNDGTIQFDGTAAQSRQVTILVTGDRKVERDEMFQFALGAISGLDPALLSRITIMGSPRSVTIVNEDAATLTVSGPGSRAEGNGVGTTAFEFTITLSDPIASGFSIPFQTLDGSATVVGNDYVDNDGTVTFNGTAQSQTIQVLVNRDPLVENDETFRFVLGQVTGLDPALAERLTVDTAPVTATISNDDTASIGFAAASSSVLEIDTPRSVAVRLQVPGGGTLSETVTLAVVVRSTSTAGSSDFTLVTPSLTFPAGSGDGATQNIQLNLTQDGVIESLETIVLGLELSPGSLSGVSLGSGNTHTVSITDDAFDAVLSGRAWVDADNDRQLELGERTIPGVTVRLAGTTLSGEPIDRQTTTDANGLYQFTGLPAGTYTIIETQPADFIDGQEILGRVAGNPNGVASNDRFENIQLGPSQTGSGFHFGEVGPHASQVVRHRFLARPRSVGLLGSEVTAAMLSPSQASTSITTNNFASGSATNLLTSSSSGEGERIAESIAPPLVQRAGSQLIIGGTSAPDQIRIVPATHRSETAAVQIEINGQAFDVAALEIDSITVLPSGGDDLLTLHDSRGDDVLRVERDRVILESDDLRVEAIAVDLVQALSRAGGRDRVDETTDTTALDFVLELVGSWNQL